MFSAENTSVFALQKREAPYGRDQSPRSPLWPPGGEKSNYTLRMNNIVIEIPFVKKEDLRVAAYYRVSFEEQRTVWIRRFNIIQTILTIMGAGYWQAYILSRRRALALITEPHSIV